jgi:hypothetical protein
MPAHPATAIVIAAEIQRSIPVRKSVSMAFLLEFDRLKRRRCPSTARRCALAARSWIWPIPRASRHANVHLAISVSTRDAGYRPGVQTGTIQHSKKRKNGNAGRRFTATFVLLLVFSAGAPRRHITRSLTSLNLYINVSLFFCKNI